MTHARHLGHWPPLIKPERRNLLRFWLVATGIPLVVIGIVLWIAGRRRELLAFRKPSCGWLVGLGLAVAVFVGAEIVISATDDPAVNEAVASAARSLRIPVNVADNAALSSFIMPSVIDRPPMQIAISSGGNSPVLARKIRTMLETLVPLPAPLASLLPLVDLVRTLAAQRKRG